MRSILNKSFRYTPAASTDIRKTFARARKANAAAEAARLAAIIPAPADVAAVRSLVAAVKKWGTG